MKRQIFNLEVPLTLDTYIREEITELYNARYSMSEFSRTRRISKRGVPKVIHHCQQYGAAEPFRFCGKNLTK